MPCNVVPARRRLPNIAPDPPTGGPDRKSYRLPRVSQRLIGNGSR